MEETRNWTITKIDEFFMAWISSSEISSPLGSLSLMKVLMPLSHKALYKWLVKPSQVSSPLKLQEIAYFHRRVDEEVLAPSLFREAIDGIYKRKIKKRVN